MGYINNFFSKEIEELEYNDIVDFFIEEKTESDILEFKSYPSINANINECFEGIIRCICALLNSEGGLLIWGAPKGTIPEGRKEKIYIGELSCWSAFVTRSQDMC